MRRSGLGRGRDLSHGEQSAGPAESEHGENDQPRGHGLHAAEPQPRSGAAADRGLNLGYHRDRERCPRHPADVPDHRQEQAAVVLAGQRVPDLLPVRQLAGDRRTAQPVEQHRQPGHQGDQGEQRGDTAEYRGQPAPSAHRRSGSAWPDRGRLGWSHVPGPVTPVTQVAVADSEALIQLTPISDSTLAGSLTVTVTRIVLGPITVAVPLNSVTEREARTVARYAWAAAIASAGFTSNVPLEYAVDWLTCSAPALAASCAMAEALLAASSWAPPSMTSPASASSDTNMMISMSVSEPRSPPAPPAPTWRLAPTTPAEPRRQGQHLPAPSRS